MEKVGLEIIFNSVFFMEKESSIGDIIKLIMERAGLEKLFCSGFFKERVG